MVFQKAPHTAQWKITPIHIYVVCLHLPGGAFLFFSIHNAHTFARPDIFRKVWKMKRSLLIGTAFPNAVPMGKLLFLPVRLRDVNVPIS